MKFKAFISILFLHMSLLSCAQWSTNPAVNNIICNLAGEQAIPKVAVCANGDTYFGYFSSEGGNYNVRLQKLDVQGNILWAANGILISNHPQETWLTDWDMTCDASNHAILAFNDIRSSGNTNVVAYRISPSGTFVWGADGIMLSNSTAFNAAPKVTVTAAGNAVFAWQADDVTILQKISPTGTKMWGTNGITLSGSARYTWPQLLPVGSDDVILKYFLDTGPSYSPTRHVYAQRYNTSGSPVWATPAAISTAGGISAWTQIFSFINDGSDGFYIAWHDDRDNNMLSSSFVQHVNASGTVVFAANGVEVSLLNTMNHFYPYVAQPTGSTDAFVFWNEMDYNQNLRGIYGQKVNAAGALQWTNSGMSFIPVTATNVYPYDAKGTPTDVVVFYEEYFNAIDGQIKAMRIATDGSYVWSPSQKTICSVQSEKVHPVVSDLNNTQWILGWEDDRTGDKDIYAQNIQLNGNLGPVVVTTGTIAGTITLNGGTGNVTQVLVQAGTNSTSPNASGYYSMVVPTGTYTVTASLTGYTTASQPNVTVQTNQTTTVNLALTPVPMGNIEGTVTLMNGTGNITLVNVMVGSTIVHPDVTGHYVMSVTPGTHDVIGTLTAYTPDTVHNVVVVNGQTTSNIDLFLSLAPTTGTITGTVTLNGGTGNVTDVEVTAGFTTVHPNTSGFYTMVVPVGTYDVSASLTGYITQTTSGVQVLPGQVTPNVNFTLYPQEQSGTITGNVSLTGGVADVTLATVTAGGFSTHPDADGDYVLVVPAATYSVTASHPYANSQTINNVVVTAGMVTQNVNFVLTVVRTDLVCMAFDNWGMTLNDVYVEFTGPEGTYTGFITEDSLVFLNVPYGLYAGSATWWGYISEADTTINENNHHLIFDFIIPGIQELDNHPKLAVFPNPVTPESKITYSLPSAGSVSIDLVDIRGRYVNLIRDQQMDAGKHVLDLKSYLNMQDIPEGMYLLTLSGSGMGRMQCKLVILR